MAFQLIDIETWDRKEYYLHYLHEVVCTYSVNVEIEITRLKGYKLYPAMLWLLTDTVNDFKEFRTHLSLEGLGIFDTMHPSYTIFNQEKKNFSVIWTEFVRDYNTFLQRYTEDQKKYQTADCMCPKPDAPPNCFDISMIPWITFTGFNLNIYGDGNYLLPIFTMGKAFDRGGKQFLPLSIQVHHAVCDGYHVAQFVEALQEKIHLFPKLEEQI